MPPQAHSRAAATCSRSGPNSRARRPITGDRRAGIYAAGGMVEYFDADVSLMANFGGTVGADSTPTTGTVGDNDGLLIGDNDHREASPTSWPAAMAVDGSLTLRRATIIAGAENGDSSVRLRRHCSGATLAGRAMEGNWGGQFYGRTMRPRIPWLHGPNTPRQRRAPSAPMRRVTPMTRSGSLGSFGTWKAD